MAADTQRYPDARPTTTSGVVATEQTVVVSRKNISWGAIIAGVVIVLVTQIGFNFLGLAIGATTINPLTERNPVEPALGTAAVLWFVGTGMLALFLGGWAAGHLSNTVDQTDGMLHGLVTWGAAALITFLLLTTAAGNVLSGLAGAVGQGASLLGQGAVQAIPSVADSLNLQGLTLDTITQESRSLFASPAAGEDAAATEGTGAQPSAAGESAAVANLEDLAFNNSIIGFLNSDQTDAEARQNLATTIAERAGITEEEANAQIDRWTTAFNQVRDDAEATAREVGEQLTNTLSVVAGGLFLAMVLGAFAGGVGGWMGTHNPPGVTTTTRRTTR